MQLVVIFIINYFRCNKYVYNECICSQTKNLLQLKSLFPLPMCVLNHLLAYFAK